MEWELWKIVEGYRGRSLGEKPAASQPRVPLLAVQVVSLKRRRQRLQFLGISIQDFGTAELHQSRRRTIRSSPAFGMPVRACADSHNVSRLLVVLGVLSCGWELSPAWATRLQISTGRVLFRQWGFRPSESAVSDVSGFAWLSQRKPVRAGSWQRAADMTSTELSEFKRFRSIAQSICVEPLHASNKPAATSA